MNKLFLKAMQVDFSVERNIFGFKICYFCIFTLFHYLYSTSNFYFHILSFLLCVELRSTNFFNFRKQAKKSVEILKNQNDYLALKFDSKLFIFLLIEALWPESYQSDSIDEIPIREVWIRKWIEFLWRDSYQVWHAQTDVKFLLLSWSDLNAEIFPSLVPQSYRRKYLKLIYFNFFQLSVISLTQWLIVAVVFSNNFTTKFQTLKSLTMSN